MKLNLINLIFIFCILDSIETTLNIFEFSFYGNQLSLVIYSDNQITENITLILTLNKHTINGTNEYTTYPIIYFKLTPNNISNTHTAFLDNFYLGEFTELSLRYVEVNSNSYVSVNRRNPETQINIINGFSVQNSNKNKYIIYLTKLCFFKNKLNMMTYCEPKPSGNINLLVTISIEIYNGTSYNIEDEIIKLVINNTTNIFNSILQNLIIKRYDELTITKVNIESNNNNSIYYIYFPTTTLIFRNKTDEDIIEYPSIKPISISTKYYINITNISIIDNNKLYLSINYEPQIPNNVNLLLTIVLRKYNGSKWSEEDIDIKTLLESNTYKFTSFSQSLNVEEYARISINNGKIDYDDWYNNYYLYYNLESLYINEDKKVTDESWDYASYDENEDDDELSTGIKILIFAGIILVIIGISIASLFIYKCIKNRRNRNIAMLGNNNLNINNMNNINNDINTHNTNISESFYLNNNSLILTTATGSVILKEPKENMRTFIFQTQNQDKEIFSIESDKSMKELRKLYFEKINQNELLNDKNIFFLFKGKHFTNDTNGFVKDYFNDYTNPNIIIVVDNEEKIKYNKNLI